MIQQILVIYDLKAKLYSAPVFVPHVAAGVRGFGDAVNASNSEYHKHPEDYILFHIGTYNDNDATIETIKPVELAKALALKEPT